MPVYEIEDPQTGRVIELEGDSPPTEQELEEIFRGLQPEDKGFLQTLASEAKGIGENVLSMGTGLVADTVGGIAGLAKTITSGPEAGEDVLRNFQQALTYQPRTPEGQRNFQAIGEWMNDVSELDKDAPIPIVHQLRQVFGQEDNAVGNFMAGVARQTGSPTLEAFAGAFGSTLGPAVLETLGFKGSGKIARGTGLKAKRASDAVAFVEMQKAMPTPEKYIQVAKGVFKETDRIGATIKPEAMPELSRTMREVLAEGGYRPDVNPISPIERTLEILDSGQILTTADMRELGKAMAKMGEAGSHQQALGLAISSQFDDFMTRPDILNIPKGASPQIAESYRIARNMYGQGKRAQTLQRMVEFAGSEGKDFIQTMNTQLNALVKKQIFGKGEGRFFSKADKVLMESMMAETRPEKWLQNLSKLSPFRSNAGGLAQIIAGIAGVGAGVGSESVISGSLVAGIPVALGEGARIWGEAIFKSKIKLGGALLQAGNRGKKIAIAYIENTPKSQRNPEHLGRLLADPRINWEGLPQSKFTREAMKIADQKRAEMLRAIAATSAEPLVTEPE